MTVSCFISKYKVKTLGGTQSVPTPPQKRLPEETKEKQGWAGGYGQKVLDDTALSSMQVSCRATNPGKYTCVLAEGSSRRLETKRTVPTQNPHRLGEAVLSEMIPRPPLEQIK